MKMGKTVWTKDDFEITSVAQLDRPLRFCLTSSPVPANQWPYPLFHYLSLLYRYIVLDRRAGRIKQTGHIKRINWWARAPLPGLSSTPWNIAEMEVFLKRTNDWAQWRRAAWPKELLLEVRSLAARISHSCAQNLVWCNLCKCEILRSFSQ